MYKDDSNIVQIANPIYDVVFKFLMADNRVAKLLLSAIIGHEIIELKFDPTETTTQVRGSITVLRMDFKATVKYEDGPQQVIIIELQKAKLHTDIMRFRKYLGEQYLDSNNSVVRETYTTPDGKIVEKRDGLPIVSIYFLGYPLDFAHDIPVIKVARTYIDVATGNEIKTKERFIESLTHDSFVIQIPYVQGKRRTDLEKLLYFFDQSNAEAQKTYKKFLQIDEEKVPKRYRLVLSRLIKAIATPKVIKQMDAEEDILAELQDYERIIDGMKAEVEIDKAEIEEAKAEIEEAKAEIEETKAEAKAEIEEAKAETQNLLKTSIQGMLKVGLPVEQIANILNQPIELIQSIKDKL